MINKPVLQPRDEVAQRSERVGVLKGIGSCPSNGIWSGDCHKDPKRCLSVLTERHYGRTRAPWRQEACPMHKRGSFLSVLFTLGLFIWTGSITPFRAQEPSSAAEAASEPANQDIFKNLSFRNLGPAAAGGRVTAVV